jgi:hypothetical protein
MIAKEGIHAVPCVPAAFFFRPDVFFFAAAGRRLAVYFW